MTRIDTDFIFEKVGGPTELRKLLLAQESLTEKDLPYGRVQMWKQRRIISAEYIGAVLLLLHLRYQIDPLKCLTDDDPF